MASTSTTSAVSLPEPDISVVVPVYNSEGTLAELVTRVLAVLSGMGFAQIELILVDDASRDGSWAQIRTLQAQYPTQVYGFRFSRNVGQHMATLCGLRNARAPWIFTLDDDLEHPPEAFAALWQRRNSPNAVPVDVVFAQSSLRYQHWTRRVGSRLLRIMGYLLLGTSRWGTPFRLLRREAIKDILRHRQPTIFIDVLLHRSPLHAEVVSIEFDTNRGRGSRYRLLKLLAYGFRLLWWYTPLPLYVLGTASATFLGLGGLVALEVLPAFGGPATALLLGLTGILLAGQRVSSGYQWRHASANLLLSQYIVAETTAQDEEATP